MQKQLDTSTFATKSCSFKAFKFLPNHRGTYERTTVRRKTTIYNLLTKIRAADRSNVMSSWTLRLLQQKVVHSKHLSFFLSTGVRTSVRRYDGKRQFTPLLTNHRAANRLNVMSSLVERNVDSRNFVRTDVRSYDGTAEETY